MIRAFIFDVDGTLVDTRDIHTNAWKKALAAVGIELSAEAIQGQLGRRAVDIIEDFIPEDRPELRADVLDKKWRAFRDAYADIKVFPKTKELFAYLHDKGLELALATSAKRQDAEFYVELLSAGPYLKAVVAAEDTEHSKPHPEIFLKAAALLGVAPEEAVVVGDSAHDIEAAVRAGMTPVGVLTGGNTESILRDAGAERVYADIENLYEHIREIL
ncbi:MAG: HAD family phosphatase [Actinobacteria bacterium]|nr:HAD family phosphatase [Actinomycetota bacterium]